MKYIKEYEDFSEYQYLIENENKLEMLLSRLKINLTSAIASILLLKLATVGEALPKGNVLVWIVKILLGLIMQRGFVKIYDTIQNARINSKVHEKAVQLAIAVHNKRPRFELEKINHELKYLMERTPYSIKLSKDMESLLQRSGYNNA